MSSSENERSVDEPQKKIMFAKTYRSVTVSNSEDKEVSQYLRESLKLTEGQVESQSSDNKVLKDLRTEVIPAPTTTAITTAITTTATTTDIPEWTDEIDRFHNFKTDKQISPTSMIKSVKEILVSLQSGYDSNPDSLTYILEGNCFYCKITLDEFKTCEFSITVFRYKDGLCLLDVQELFGEHFTFSAFLESFKNDLRKSEL
ncbi:hypothetical protein RFI_30666, partial [Reticulomyxa filosa]